MGAVAVSAVRPVLRLGCLSIPAGYKRCTTQYGAKACELEEVTPPFDVFFFSGHLALLCTASPVMPRLV